MKRIIATQIFAFTIFIQAFGWGQLGHDTTCSIAEKNLTKKARSRISSILGGKSLLYYSNWLDNASNTPDYSYTKTWHYKNIDEGQTFQNAPTLETGTIQTALHEIIEKLSSHKLSKEEEQLNLKMLIHLMGDLHQPMHLGHKSDRGGNDVIVKFFNSDIRLHQLWDTPMLERAHKWSHSEWRDEVDRVSRKEKKEIQKGNIEDWGEETFNICCEVYSDSPVGKNLSYNYVSKWTPVLEQQLLRGGLRLAKVLNSIY